MKSRWFISAVLVVAGIYLGVAAISNWWAADVPPRVDDEYWNDRGNALAMASFACLALAGILPMVKRRRPRSQPGGWGLEKGGLPGLQIPIALPRVFIAHPEALPGTPLEGIWTRWKAPGSARHPKPELR